MFQLAGGNLGEIISKLANKSPQEHAVFSFACIMSAALVVAQQIPEETKKDLQRLQGTWKVQSGEMAGTKINPKKLGIDEIIVRDDRMTMRLGGKDVAEYQFTIDATKKPKAMNWLSQKKPSLPIIYAVEEKELRLCFPLLPTKSDKDPNKPLERPTSFETKDKTTGLVIAQRAK
jgi:uncharacterized protein (TIGR03067 family)